MTKIDTISDPNKPNDRYKIVHFFSWVGLLQFNITRQTAL